MINKIDLTKADGKFQQKRFKKSITTDKRLDLIVLGKDGNVLVSQLIGVPLNPDLDRHTVSLIINFVITNLERGMSPDEVMIVDPEEDRVSLADRKEFLKM